MSSCLPPHFNICIFIIFLIAQLSLQEIHYCLEEKCVSACEPYWEENGNHCYLWSTDKKNWTEAEDFCQRKGAHLASVTSTAINDYVLEGKDKRQMYQLWIGGSDLEVNGVWKWTDCSVWDFTFWRPGEPNDHLGSQDCLNIHPEDRKWDDYQCYTKSGFLCGQRICSGRHSPTL